MAGLAGEMFRAFFFFLFRDSIGIMAEILYLCVFAVCLLLRKPENAVLNATLSFPPPTPGDTNKRCATSQAINESQGSWEWLSGQKGSTRLSY